MDSLFREVGSYSTVGQLYESVDAGLLINYHESKDGQILEEGITEAGSTASLTAAGTSYATHGEITIPFYIFYSMFGFQRTGDLFWAFGDARGRGFALGATAGRTTLNGEGLQHEDGHSQVLATTIPNVLAYDPAFAYEVAMIVKNGLHRMYEKLEDVFYYITLYNENIAHPPMPEGTEEGIIKDFIFLNRQRTGCRITSNSSAAVRSFRPSSRRSRCLRTHSRSPPMSGARPAISSCAMRLSAPTGGTASTRKLNRKCLTWSTCWRGSKDPSSPPQIS
jgi:pyruvate dehydrogenase complex dehydrogenase (E1) component